MITKFDLGFIDRTIRTAGAVLLISLIFGTYYYGFWNALAFFSGGIWGLVNLILLKRFVTEVFKPDGIDTASAIVIGLVKFPLLYAAGYFLMTVKYFDVKILVIGFTSVLVIMVLKAMGRVFLGMDTRGNTNPVQKVM